MALIEKSEGLRPITFATGGCAATRVFTCLWNERYSVMPRIGESHPDMSALRLRSVTISGFGKNVVTGGWDSCKLVCNYSTAQGTGQQASDHIEESITFGGEMLSRPGGKWKDCEEEVKDTDIAGAWYPRTEYVRIIVVDDINAWISKIKNASGKMNSSSWLGGGKYTWLFQGGDASAFVDQTGNRRWKITLRFIYRETGWHRAWHKECTFDGEKVARWEELRFKPDGGGDYSERLYESTNFNSLLEN